MDLGKAFYKVKVKGRADLLQLTEKELVIEVFGYRKAESFTDMMKSCDINSGCQQDQKYSKVTPPQKNEHV